MRTGSVRQQTLSHPSTTLSGNSNMLVSSRTARHGHPSPAIQTYTPSFSGSNDQSSSASSSTIRFHGSGGFNEMPPPSQPSSSIAAVRRQRPPTTTTGQHVTTTINDDRQQLAQQMAGVENEIRHLLQLQQQRAAAASTDTSIPAASRGHMDNAPFTPTSSHTPSKIVAIDLTTSSASGTTTPRAAGGGGQHRHNINNSNVVDPIAALPSVSGTLLGGYFDVPPLSSPLRDPSTPSPSLFPAPSVTLAPSSSSVSLPSSATPRRQLDDSKQRTPVPLPLPPLPVNIIELQRQLRDGQLERERLAETLKVEMKANEEQRAYVGILERTLAMKALPIVHDVAPALLAMVGPIEPSHVTNSLTDFSKTNAEPLMATGTNVNPLTNVDDDIMASAMATSSSARANRHRSPRHAPLSSSTPSSNRSMNHRRNGSSNSDHITNTINNHNHPVTGHVVTGSGLEDVMSRAEHSGPALSYARCQYVMELARARIDALAKETTSARAEGKRYIVGNFAFPLSLVVILYGMICIRLVEEAISVKNEAEDAIRRAEIESLEQSRGLTERVESLNKTLAQLRIDHEYVVYSLIICLVV
jgi:hypothetical protein